MATIKRNSYPMSVINSNGYCGCAFNSARKFDAKPWGNNRGKVEFIVQEVDEW